MSDFKQVKGTGENGSKPVFIDENWAEKMGIPIIEAKATVTYPVGKHLRLQDSPTLDFDTVEFMALTRSKLYGFWALWDGNVDELVNWIKTNEKLGAYKVLKSSCGRSLWAWVSPADFAYFCDKFKAGDVTASVKTAVMG